MKTKNLIGIGVDVVNVNRFESINRNEKFINKVFSKKEIEFCKSKVNSAERFAARFAGKEAIIKAFSVFDKKLNLIDVEIIKRKGKNPEVFIDNSKGFHINLSISHEKDYAVGFALVIKK